MKDLILDNLEYGKILLYFSLATIIITIITHLIFKRYRFMKYLPGIIAVFIGIYYLYKIGTDYTTQDGLNNILFFMVSFFAGIIGMLSALIIGVFNKEKKIKKNKKENKEQ